MALKNSIVVDLVNNFGCFDLQFRKDTKSGRTGSPTYYRWKTQFVVTRPKDGAKELQELLKILKCGKVHLTQNQARFSVQKIDDIKEFLIPYFTENQLEKNKKRDFELWQKAVEIIYRNKGLALSKWKKNDLAKLIDFQKQSAKLKDNKKEPKWLQVAQVLAKQ